MGLVKLGSGTSSVWVSERGHSQQQDVECCRSQGAALLSWGLLGKRKKHFIFLLLSAEKLQAGGVRLVSRQSHFLYFQSCLFVEFWAPKHPLCSISLPPKRIGCETDTSQGHQEGSAAYSLPPPVPSSLVYIKLNIQIPPLFNMNRRLWSLTFYLPYQPLRNLQPVFSLFWGV